jgi:hypothetical protein
LPYWYWDNPDGSQLVLHDAFLPGGPLYVKDRSATANGGNPIDDIDSLLNDPRSGTGRAMIERRFVISSSEPVFGGPFSRRPLHYNPLHGQLEGDGHDTIHVDSGGGIRDG